MDDVLIAIGFVLMILCLSGAIYYQGYLDATRKMTEELNILKNDLKRMG